MSLAQVYLWHKNQRNESTTATARFTAGEPSVPKPSVPRRRPDPPGAPLYVGVWALLQNWQSSQPRSWSRECSLLSQPDDRVVDF